MTKIKGRHLRRAGMKGKEAQNKKIHRFGGLLQTKKRTIRVAVRGKSDRRGRQTKTVPYVTY